jgi:hypothetical protein
MTAEFLWINVPFMVLFFALWAGIPMWIIVKRPDRHPRETSTLPACLRQRVPADLPAQGPAQARSEAERRELVPVGRS